nr:M1 family metallopeptidase [Nocardioidaceae bacterium]
ELELAESEPVEDPYYPEKSNPEIDSLHYHLDLLWVGRVLSGVTTLTFRATEDTSAIRLDLSGALSADSVELDGEPIEYTQSDDGLEMSTPPLTADSTYRLRIAYSGVPEPTPAPSQRSDMTSGLGWSVDPGGNVHTFQEPYGAFTWYPVNDHPSDEALYDATVTTRGDDVAVFNGELVGTDTADGKTIARWHVGEPVASYLVTIAIGPYTEYTDMTPGGMELSYWLLPGDKRLLPRLTADGDAAFDWLVEHAGPYPFESLGVLVVGGTSGMETQTMITLSAGAVERSDAVLLHEMAHQWYGDSVTPVDWKGMWLNEGWAMYMQQWFETDTGRPPYAGGIEYWRPLDMLSRATAGPPGDYDPQAFGESNVYLGPAMMLDEIRKRIGDAEFERIVKAWAAEHENQQVDRVEFTRWINDETGENLTPLIDRWLDSPQTPRR